MCNRYIWNTSHSSEPGTIRYEHNTVQTQCLFTLVTIILYQVIIRLNWYVGKYELLFNFK